MIILKIVIVIKNYVIYLKSFIKMLFIISKNLTNNLIVKDAHLPY